MSVSGFIPNKNRAGRSDLTFFFFKFYQKQVVISEKSLRMTCPRIGYWKVPANITWEVISPSPRQDARMCGHTLLKSTIKCLGSQLMSQIITFNSHLLVWHELKSDFSNFLTWCS